MKDGVLRAQKDRLLEPLARIVGSSLSPNLISILALLPGLLSAAAIVRGELGWGIAFWLLNRLLDGLDGVVARIHGTQSDFGGYLDLLLDYVIYLAIPIAFAWAAPTPAHTWTLIALLASYQINSLSWTLLSSLLEKRSLAGQNRLTSIEMPAGLIEGAETVVFYTLFFLLPGQIPRLFGLMAGLVIVTAGQRVWWAWGKLE
ncbi:MAG: CDP-alcohol phosphatidyltransferase family protein [Caldilineaceae bacterium]|nr:CDP-alcohol phosphatidyltransferase family protein [Caldilineaceae bacterium]